MAKHHDDFWAGLFLLVGVGLALTVVFILADFRSLTQSYQRVALFYTLADGVEGLKPGATVKLGGVPVGSVIKIADRIEDGRVTGQVVTIQLPERYRIHQDAVIELEKPPIGSGTALNIRDVGIGEVYREDGPPLQGRRSGSDLVKDMIRELGIKEQQKQQLRTIIERVASVMQQADETFPEVRGKVNDVLDRAAPAVDDARAVASDTRQVVADFKQRSGGWFDRADRITTNVDRASADVSELVTEQGPVVRETIDNAKAGVDNFRAVSQRVREQTMDQVESAIADARGAMDNASQTIDRVKLFVDQQRPVLERALASFQLTAAQLKLASIEIRRSPWRLLYRPKEQELESDNLYDAARSFAQAAEVLDATAESLEATARQDDISREEIQRMIDRLERLFAEYDKAEQKFWDALERQPAP